MIEFIYARFIGLFAAVAVSSMLISSGQIFTMKASEIQAESTLDRLSDAVENALQSSSRVFEISIVLDHSRSEDCRILINESKFIIAEGENKIIRHFKCKASILPEEFKDRFILISGTIIKVRSERASPEMDPMITIEIIT